MKFLVVDDDPVILKLLIEILFGFGFEDVRSAQSGSEALRLISTERIPFDCLMLDVQMPEMDGIELCRAIRREPKYTSSPIIMITVMQDTDHIMRAFEAGATDFTVKPFNVRELIERIRVAEIVKDPEQARQLSLSRAQSHRRPDTVSNLISRAALESYVRNCRTLKLNSPCALAVCVLPFDTFSVSDVARSIVEVFDGNSVFMTYVGSGEFLLICDRYSKIPADVARTRLPENLIGKPGGRAGFQVRTGVWTSPGRFENSNNHDFLDRAINSCREGPQHLQSGSSHANQWFWQVQ